MMRTSSLIRVAVIATLTAAPASATPFQATLSMRFGALGTIAFTGSGSGTSTPERVSLPSGVFSGTGMAVAAAPFGRLTAFSVTLAGQHAGAFQPTRFRTGAHGPMRVDGSLRVKGTLAGNPLTIFAVPLYTIHEWGSAPGAQIGLGVGRLLRFSAGVYGSRYLVVYHDDWRESQAFVSDVTKMTTYHVPAGMAASMIIAYTYTTPVRYTGADSRTPGGLGQIILISPTTVTSNITGQNLRFVMLNTLTIQFTPEPGTLLLVGAGAALLGAFAHRRKPRRTAPPRATSPPPLPGPRAPQP